MPCDNFLYGFKGTPYGRADRLAAVAVAAKLQHLRGRGQRTCQATGYASSAGRRSPLGRR